jgi:ApaG protein
MKINIDSLPENPDILVHARPSYVQVQSDPEHQKFVWAYEITIKNNSNQILQLLSRVWTITDMTSHVERIEGIGVVGMQPLIKPGKEFSYQSFCQLTTPQGTMEGKYVMQNLEEELSLALIPKFILSAPPGILRSFGSRLH